MMQVLVDTSALVAFFVASERHHLAVKQYFSDHSSWFVGWASCPNRLEACLTAFF